MDDDFYQKVETKDPEPEAILEEKLSLRLLRYLTPEEKQRLLELYKEQVSNSGGQNYYIKV